jgi:hypothetical protein
MERTRIYRAALALDNFTIGELAAHSGANTNTVRNLVTARSRGRPLFEVVGAQQPEGRGRPALRYRLHARDAVQDLLREQQRALTDDPKLIEQAAQPLALPKVHVPQRSAAEDLLLTLSWAESQIPRASAEDDEGQQVLAEMLQQAAEEILTAPEGMLDEEALDRARLVEAFARLLRSRMRRTEPEAEQDQLGETERAQQRVKALGVSVPRMLIEVKRPREREALTESRRTAFVCAAEACDYRSLFVMQTCPSAIVAALEPGVAANSGPWSGWSRSAESIRMPSAHRSSPALRPNAADVRSETTLEAFTASLFLSALVVYEADSVLPLDVRRPPRAPHEDLVRYWLMRRGCEAFEDEEAFVTGSGVVARRRDPCSRRGHFSAVQSLARMYLAIHSGLLYLDAHALGARLTEACDPDDGPLTLTKALYERIRAAYSRSDHVTVTRRRPTGRTSGRYHGPDAKQEDDDIAAGSAVIVQDYPSGHNPRFSTTEALADFDFGLYSHAHIGRARPDGWISQIGQKSDDDTVVTFDEVRLREAAEALATKGALGSVVSFDRLLKSLWDLAVRLGEVPPIAVVASRRDLPSDFREFLDGFGASAWRQEPLEEVAGAWISSPLWAASLLTERRIAGVVLRYDADESDSLEEIVRHIREWHLPTMVQSGSIEALTHATALGATPLLQADAEVAMAFIAEALEDRAATPNDEQDLG